MLDDHGAPVAAVMPRALRASALARRMSVPRTSSSRSSVVALGRVDTRPMFLPSRLVGDMVAAVRARLSTCQPTTSRSLWHPGAIIGDQSPQHVDPLRNVVEFRFQVTSGSGKA